MNEPMIFKSWDPRTPPALQTAIRAWKREYPTVFCMHCARPVANVSILILDSYSADPVVEIRAICHGKLEVYKVTVEAAEDTRLFLGFAPSVLCGAADEETP